MALNVPKILIDTLWATVESRAAFTAVVKEADRVKTSAFNYPEKDAKGIPLPARYPRASCYGTGDSAGPAPKVFRTGSPTTTVDYGVPMTVTFEFKLIFDRLQDDVTTVLESEVEAALHLLVIAMHAAGYRWLGGVTWRKARANRKNNETGKVLRTVATWSITADCRPKLSALAAT